MTIAGVLSVELSRDDLRSIADDIPVLDVKITEIESWDDEVGG